MPLAGDGETGELVRQGRVAQALLWFVAAAWWRPAHLRLGRGPHSRRARPDAPCGR